MVFEWDDLGANHIISDQCQSHDCRIELDKLHYANPNFKATLFAIPAEMTIELLDWCKANEGWIQLAVHGWKHTSNYEASEWTKEQMLEVMHHPLVQEYFVKGFRAPGWQISNGCYEALLEEGWWVADQSYQNEKRPKELKAYVNHNGVFTVNDEEVPAWHGHVWNCVGNGIQETYDEVERLVKNATEFKFVGDLFA